MKKVVRNYNENNIKEIVRKYMKNAKDDIAFLRNRWSWR